MVWLIAHLRPRFGSWSWDPRGLDEPDSSSLRSCCRSRVNHRASPWSHPFGDGALAPKSRRTFPLRHPGRVLSMTFLNMQVKSLESSLDFDTPYETDFQALFSELEQSPSTASSIAASLTSGASEAGLDPMTETETDESEAVLSAMNRDLRKPVLRPFRDANSTMRFARQMIDFWHYDVNAVAGKVDVPILFFASEYDRIAAPKASEWARGLFPRARLLQAPGATHYFLYDRADVVARMIEWFASGDGMPERSDGHMPSLDPTNGSSSADTAWLRRAEK